MSVKIEDGLTAKQRYAKKKFDSAEIVDCACGCGKQLKAFDKYARPASYINGHNTRKYEGEAATRTAATMRWKAKRPDKVKAAKNAFYLKRKIMAVELKGATCVHCSLSYNGRNSSVFDFHHSDPNFKEENISKMLVNKAWQTTLEELEKCILLCANCHRLEHNKGEQYATEDNSPSGD